MNTEMNPVVKRISLEASTICQLKCCSFRDGIKNSAVGIGYLKFKDFKKLVDANSVIKKIELSNWGEIFLNPELGEIIKYADKKNILLTARNGVNLNHASKKVLKYLVKYKFKEMSVSLDGATDEVYKIYRIGGNLNKVIENIKTINYFKKKYKSDCPALTWQFILFGHSEHELPKAKKMAEELNMKFRTKLNALKDYSPVKDEEFVKKESGMDAVSRKEYKKKYRKSYLLPCKRLWFSPQINWDGKLLGCCANKWVDFGNVFNDGLEKCINSEKYITTKKFLLGIITSTDDGIPCFKCIHYDKGNVENLINILRKKNKISGENF